MVKTALLTFLILLPQLLFAAELSSTITPNSGTTADEFIFTVTVEGTSDTTRPVLTRGSDFDVSYTGPQASVTIINGSMNAVVSHLYRLYPKKTGALLTPSAEVTIEGKTLSTVPLTVEVRKSKDLSASTGATFFLEQLVDSNTVYAGQQVVNSLRLYSREPVLEANFSDLSFDSVWVEEMGKQETYRKNVGGKIYTVHELKRALFPLVAADFNLPQREIQIKVVDKSTNNTSPLSRFGLFSGNVFGFQQVTIKRLKSEPLDIRVMALPPVPQNLKSAQADSIPVGETHLSVGLNTESMNIGESKTISFVVESTGNLNPLEEIPFPDLPEVKVYPEHPSVSHSVRNDKLLTKKTFKYALVPLRGGTFKLPPVELLYFDPLRRNYEVTSTRETSFFVKGEAGKNKETKLSPLSQDKPVSKEAPVLTPEKGELYSVKAGFWDRVSIRTVGLLFAALLTIFLIAIFFLLRYRRQKVLHQILTNLQRAHKPEEVRALLCEYLTKNLDVTPPLTPGDLKSRIELVLADKGLAFKILSLLDELEVMSYSNREDIRPLEAVKEELNHCLLVIAR